MRARMNLLSTLAFIAIGLFLPAFSISMPTTTEPYELDDRPMFVLDTKAYGDPPSSVIVIRYDPVLEWGLTYFKEQPDQLAEYMKPRNLSSYTPISIDKVPVHMLTLIVDSFNELYSEALPHLLKKLPLDIIAGRLRKELLTTLKPEDKKKISPKVLAELEKLYDSTLYE